MTEEAGYVLSEDAARRTAAAVRKIEDLPPGTITPGRGRPPGPGDQAWYRIKSNDGAGAYTLRRSAWNATTNEFMDVTDTNDHEFNLDVTGYEANADDSGAVDAIVPGFKAFVNGDWVTLILLAAAGAFAVKILKDGGAAGSKTAQCSWTYTVKSLAGVTLKKNAAGDPATGMTPARPRPSLGKMEYPADNSYGLAFRAGTDLVLWDAGEVPAVAVCP